MPFGTPSLPQIGSGGGFAGGQSFLGQQNLPGQTLGGSGGRGFFNAAPNPIALDPNILSRLSGGFDGTPSAPGFNFRSGSFEGRASPSVGRSASGVQRVGNVLAGVGQGGQTFNPFTNRERFSDEEIAGLNSGELMFSGRNGPVSLAGQLMPVAAPEPPPAAPAPPLTNPFQQGNGATGLNQQTLLQLLQFLGGL
jgi:hypothetical protein